MNKEQLDRILETHKAQPVGDGYIDIIVKKENYKNLIHELIENGFKIESISWWEWCEGENESQYGLGGPKSDFYNGWFAELPVEVDDVDLTDKDSSNSIEILIELIESKSIDYPNEEINFNQSNWLTPALWLNVPDKWKNQNSA